MAGQAGAFGHGLELGPDQFRSYLRVGPDECPEAAVAARYHGLPSHQTSVADDALGYQLRVLDKVGGGVHHSGDENLSVGQLDVFKDVPLVLVPGIGPLEGNGIGLRFLGNGKDFSEGNVQVVGALVVSPAKVEPYPVRGYPLQSGV